MNKILPLSFYQSEDTLAVSRDLIGKILVTDFGPGEYCSGMIVETEAYCGVEDKACHAFNNRKTQRTKTMFQEGGIIYVYLCYGIHSLLNFVTHRKGEPHAVLIRAIEPLEGIELMTRRRGMSVFNRGLSSGPGRLTQAMGLDTSHNAMRLNGPAIKVEDHGFSYSKDELVSSPRIGVNYAGDHALLPWRFYLADNKWVSRAK